MPIEFFDLGQIDPNPFQPRETMDPAGIAELAANILATRASAPDTLGLLQTPRGRRHGAGIQLAYGHRRLAAFRYLVSQGHADYVGFPVELADLSDADMAITAWSENAVREDINPMEEAHFVRRLIDEFGWTIKQAGARLGVHHSTLSNVIRLTRLPEDVQRLVASGQIVRSRAIELVGLVDKLPADELGRLAQSAAKQGERGWIKHANQARRATETGGNLVDTVIEPAARALAHALRQDEPGAWLILARAIDRQAEDVDGAESLARLVIERAILRAMSLHDGRKRVNTMFADVGLETPWNAAATEKVTEFLAWRKKHTASKRRTA